MPFSHDADQEQKSFDKQELRRRKFFKVAEILLWAFVTIIGIGFIVMATLYAYSF